MTALTTSLVLLATLAAGFLAGLYASRAKRRWCSWCGSNTYGCLDCALRPASPTGVLARRAAARR